MSAPHHWTAVQRMFALSVPMAIGTWMIFLTTFTGTSNLLAAVVLFTAVGWLAFTTDRMGTPASSVAQSPRGAADADPMASDEAGARREPRR